VKTSAAAIWSAVLGGSSFLCCCVTGLPGLITGIVGLVNIGKSGGRLTGKGLAITGILLSIVGPVVNSGTVWALRENPTFKEMLGPMGDVFGAGATLSKGSMQATAISTALRTYADSHDGDLPVGLETLVAENLLDPSQIESPGGGSGVGFWELTAAGSKLSTLPADSVLVKGGPVKVGPESFYIVIRADGRVEPVEGNKLP
jgi:hypothetical protein